MTPDAIQRYLEDNRESFRIWGDIVVNKIVEKLKERLGIEPIPLFIKIPPVPRIKAIESALGKIGRKKYDNPLQQLTDLVGVRFVVLLSEQIKLIVNIIEQEQEWNVLISKDFQDEIEKNPKLFDYQSQHFEVRPKNNFTHDRILITNNICCEVQIRTLLQHAYAELVHDSIYKPIGPVPPKAERQVAKSMALMETTDDLFCHTMKMLSDSNKPRNELYEDLTNVYRDNIGGHFLKPDEKTNFAVFDEFRDFINDGVSSNIRQLVENKKYISIKITTRAPDSPFFCQPACLFVYWLIHEFGADVVYNRWPLPGYWRELSIIFSDLDTKPTHA